ncbi:paired immunoglobulin-like type 2 receptor alpha [Onychomys torridus]|uniref:paired immunoglobulin-like type 2 receptor alpha n=1 Tax=Onychomys torridus TaxID=38674 RepID=UPI00167F91AF|nr:paired immunoglobulin-like type 2 receptor alpha [Onychomys torridus]
MAWILLLLLSAACLQAGYSTGSNRVNGFGVNQPARLSGVQGSSIEIPFSFYFPWELAEDPQMKILWRWKKFRGEYIYNSSSGFIHKHFKNRLSLNWTQPQTSGVLRVLNLKKEDQTVYFCRVRLNTRHGVEEWQPVVGTQLTITRGSLLLGEMELALEEMDCSSPQDHLCKPHHCNFCTHQNCPHSHRREEEQTEREPGSGNHSWVGSGCCCTPGWGFGIDSVPQVEEKERTGDQSRNPSQGPHENTEDVEPEGQYVNPKENPKDNNIVYASIALSSPVSSRTPSFQPVHEDPQEETLYSIVKAK